MKKITLIILTLIATSTTLFSQNKSDLEKISLGLDQIEALSYQVSGSAASEIKQKAMELKKILREMKKEYVFRTFSDEEMAELTKQIEKEWPFKSQIIFIKKLAINSSFTIQQIDQILKTISFPDDKKKVVEILLPNSYDPENIKILYDTFMFSDDREYLDNLILNK